jgi:hypothetical protein
MEMGELFWPPTVCTNTGKIFWQPYQSLIEPDWLPVHASGLAVVSWGTYQILSLHFFTPLRKFVSLKKAKCELVGGSEFSYIMYITLYYFFLFLIL